jgi:MFS family permease
MYFGKNMRAMKPINNKALVIFASVIGNVVELYDLTIYSVLLPKIVANFFPFSNTLDSFLLSLLVFACAYFARPFGAILFGQIGDQYGRRIALIYSILLMSGSTLLIGLLPSYGSIGLAAPCLLVLLRFLQGLSMGGEFAASSIFLIECSGRKEGLAAGIIISSVVCGSILANYVGNLVIFEDMPEFVWRLPFVLGGLLAGIGVCFRIIVEETPEYKAIALTNNTSKSPIKEIYNEYLYELFLVIGVCAYAGAVSYMLIGFITLFLSSTLHLDFHEASLINYYGLFVFSVSAIFFGRVSDIIGAGKVLLISSSSAIILVAVLFYNIESYDRIDLIFLEVTLGLLAGSYCSAQLVFISKFFPTRIRCTAVCLGHSIGIALLGGTFPFVAFLLTNEFKNPGLAGIYLSLCGLIGLAFVVLGVRRQRKFSL